VIDRQQLFKAKRGDSGAGVDQDVVVDQKARGVPPAADAAAATENSEFHGVFYRAYLVV